MIRSAGESPNFPAGRGAGTSISDSVAKASSNTTRVLDSRSNIEPFLGPWRWLLGCFVGGVVVRLIVAAFAGISHDAAAYYLPNARALIDGGLDNWEAMTIAVPPLFPTLVAIVHSFVGDIEGSALCISVVSGAAMVFPVLGFARFVFPGRPMIHRFAIVVAFAHPFSVRYSGDAKADALYALLFNLALWCGLTLMRRPDALRGATFGFLVGLAYLVRPEALGLAILLTVAVIVLGWRKRQDNVVLREYAVRVFLAGVIAVLFLLPSLGWNAWFVHEKIGIWTISPKAGVLQDYDKGLGDTMNSLNAEKTMTIHEERLSVQSSYQSFSPLSVLLENPGKTLRAYAGNLGEYLRVFPPAVGSLTSALLLVGLWFFSRKGRRGSLTSILTLFAFYGFSFMIFYVSRRFWLALVPILLPYCAAGGVVVALHLYRWRRVHARWVLLAMVVLLVPEGMNRSLRSGNRWFSSPEKELGQKMREDALGRGDDDLRIVSVKARATFYARGTNLTFPSNPISDIAIYMKNRDADFLVIDLERERKRRPKFVEELLTTSQFQEFVRAGVAGEELVAFRFQPGS